MNDTYAPYGFRFVQVSNAGSSAKTTVDYTLTYRIGASQRCVEQLQFVHEPSVLLLGTAIRSTTEYGGLNYNSGGYFGGYSDTYSGQVIATRDVAENVNNTILTSISVDPITIEAGAVFNNISVNGTSVALSNPGPTIFLTQVGGGSLKGKTLINFSGFTLPNVIRAPLTEGAQVVITYTITTVSGGIASVTTSDAKTVVAMPILYPAGAHSISLDYTGSNVNIAKGDVFVVNGDTYRVTGSTGNAIFITPGLQRDLLRTSTLKLQTHFEAKFENNRESFYIPSLPTTPYFGYPTGYPNETVNQPTNLTPNDLPNGDWVDLLISPKDDTEVEGREDVLLTLDVTTAANGYDAINPTVARIPIADDDVIAAAETTSNAQIPTGDGSFTIQISQPFKVDIYVPFTVLQAPGSADAIYGDDYTIANTSKDANGRVTGVALVTAGSISAVVKIEPKCTSLIAQDTSKAIRITLDDTLDYALAGSVSSSTNASASTITITRTGVTTNPPPATTGTTTTAGGTTAGATTAGTATAGATSGTTTLGTSTSGATTNGSTTTGTTTGATTTSSSNDGGGGVCGTGSGLAAILGGLSLVMARLINKRR